MIVLQAIVPQHWLSRAVGKLAGLSKPVWLKNVLVGAFMRRYDIDLSVAECGDSAAFSDFNAFLHAPCARMLGRWLPRSGAIQRMAS